MKNEMLSSLGRNGNKNVVINNNVILNLFQDLNRFVKQNKVEMLKQVQHDNRIGQRGFTLIELLVVVLIIGILASVALPQYRKAVLKSHLATLKPMVRALADAEERYYLATNSYTANIDDLDLDWQETPSRVVSTSNGHSKGYFFSWGYVQLIDNLADNNNPRLFGSVRGTNGADGDILYGYHTLYSSSAQAGKYVCRADNNLAHKICQQETNSSTPIAGSNRAYAY